MNASELIENLMNWRNNLTYCRKCYHPSQPYYVWCPKCKKLANDSDATVWFCGMSYATLFSILVTGWLS